MSDTIKEHKIVTLLVAAFTGITTGAGYYRTVKTVEDSRPAPFSDYELPAITVDEEEVELMELGIGHPYAKQKSKMTVNVKLSFKVDTMEEAREHVADIYKAAGADITLGGYCYNIIPQGHRYIRQQDESIATGVIITLQIFYETDLFQES